MKCIIEIGCNNGADSIRILEKHQNKGYTFFFYEPNPGLFLETTALLMSKFTNEKKLFFNNAVSYEMDIASFNLGELWDKGVSSLFEFSENLQTTWPGRDDFVVTSQICVFVDSLYDIIERFKITEIPFIHIDAQGADLQILKGAKNYLPIIKSGRIEATLVEAASLYKTDNNLNSIKNFLESNNFTITAVHPEGTGQEGNVYFTQNL